MDLDIPESRADDPPDDSDHEEDSLFGGEIDLDTGDSSSSSSSDIDEVDDLPPPPPVAAPRLRIGWQYVEFVAGYIVYNDPTTNINAHCGNAAHGRCHWDKRVTESSSAHRRGQGRPLGALALWLAMAHDLDTQAEHQKAKEWISSRLAREDRIRYREFWRQALGTDDLFESGREARRSDTSSEPDIVP